VNDFAVNNFFFARNSIWINGSITRFNMPKSACSVRCLCRDFLPAFASAFLFCIASSSLITLNKHIVSTIGFELPMTLSLLGMLATLLVSVVACVLTNLVPRTVALDLKFCLRRALPVRALPQHINA